MEELNDKIKNKKLLLLIAAISAVFVVAVFMITIGINKKKPINPVVPVEPKEKTMEEAIKDLSIPVPIPEGAEKVTEEIILKTTDASGNQCSNLDFVGAKTLGAVRP